MAARQGYVPAQTNLGLIYAAGEGTAKDDTAATKWFRKAAERGTEGRQSQLGLTYFSGWGVAEDIIVAYKWFRIGEETGEKKAAEYRRRAAAEMSPAQIVEAETLARAWLARHDPK